MWLNSIFPTIKFELNRSTNNGDLLLDREKMETQRDRQTHRLKLIPSISIYHKGLSKKSLTCDRMMAHTRPSIIFGSPSAILDGCMLTRIT